MKKISNKDLEYLKLKLKELQEEEGKKETEIKKKAKPPGKFISKYKFSSTYKL